jgi:beta-barrel assembly-enhancing protease
MLRKLIPIACLTAALIAGPGTLPDPASAQSNLPSLGRASSGLSEMDEKRLGREFIRNARRSMPFVEDPELTQYISDLGGRIAASGDEPHSDFRFYLIRDSALNAFAVPGGHIAVNTGLIMATESEAELASVLAHEVAHVTQHHLARMVDGSKGEGLKMLGALVAAVLLGGEAGQAAVVAANASSIENRLEYSRSFEREADGIGLQTLVRAGYDPRAMPTFFERLQRWARVYDSGAPEFLRTHPLTTDRIADTRVRAENYPHIENPDQTDFYHVRAKIRAAFSDDPGKTAAQFASNLESGDYEDETAERYGYALALSSAGRNDEAIAVIDQLLEENPDSVRHQTARGSILLDAGRFDEALAHFERTHDRWPDHGALNLYYASALIQTRHFADAKRVLKKQMLRDSDNPGIYALLARAEGEMGNSLVAHQNLAEYHYRRTNLQEAYRQLQLAEKYAGDSEYARASIEARMAEIRQEMEIFDETSGRR